MAHRLWLRSGRSGFRFWSWGKIF